MKFPQKFALVLLPVTLIHLVAITFFGVMMRINEARHSDEANHRFANSGIEAPHHDHHHTGDDVIEGIDPALFPELEPASGHHAHDGHHLTEPPNADPEPIAVEKVNSEPDSFSPIVGEEPAQLKAKEKPTIPKEIKARKPLIENEPSRRVRGFRPIATS